MTSVAQAKSETIEFPCEEWIATRTPQGELIGINPVPGSWTMISGEDRRRFAERQMNVKAFFACPRCNQVGFIPEGFKPPVTLGDTRPLGELHCRKCGFYCNVILKDWDKRILYCACYETRQGDSLEPHKEYLHAENELEAKGFFWSQHGREVTNLVGIAPAIGFFMEKPGDDRILLV
ncbi:Uncharacterised protein [uncultured archaeon]|nr:Uncharacterised protein [uncultured archaeon]